MMNVERLYGPNILPVVERIPRWYKLHKYGLLGSSDVHRFSVTWDVLQAIFRFDYFEISL